MLKLVRDQNYFQLHQLIGAADPNSQVDLVDCGMPGALPVINKYCVEQAILTGLSLNAKINKMSIFDRKNYFYPDLPQGYQISQFEHPIVGKGYVIIDLGGQKSVWNYSYSS